MKVAVTCFSSFLYCDIKGVGAKHLPSYTSILLPDIQNATDSLNDGWSAYNTNDYSKAINDSHEVISIVSDAKIVEKNYRDNASEIERIALSVSYKLKSVGATGDPDTKNAIQEANGYLNQTKQYIDAEDLQSALTYVHKADQAADSAIKLRFYYFLKANADEASYCMMLARNKISSAGELKSPDTKEMLANASQIYNQSEDDYIASQYLSAIAHANAAIKLAGDATVAEQKWHDENPLSAVTPGFEAFAASLALLVIFIMKERKG